MAIISKNDLSDLNVPENKINISVNVTYGPRAMVVTFLIEPEIIPVANHAKESIIISAINGWLKSIIEKKKGM